MGISFLSPMYLLGLALVGLPFAIHLLSRRTVKEREFSDIRFIREALTRRQKEIELEDRRLLLLRMALVGLLALALSKPVLRTSPTTVARSGKGSSVVFVVDDSFSMATSDNGVVRMDRAGAKIRGLLGFYGSGDEVSLIAASEKPRVLLKRVDPLESHLELEIERLKPSFFVSDLATGLRLAISILDEVEGKKREIYLITDMQALAWEKVAFYKEEQGQLDIDLYLVDVGMPGQRNTAITNSRVDLAGEQAGKTLQQLEITLQMKAYGPAPKEMGILREVVGGREEASVTVRLQPDQPTEQTFTNWVRHGDMVTGYGELGHDPLTLDNRRFFVHGGGGERNILFLEGNPKGSPADPDLPEGFYLQRALDVLKDRLALNLRYEEASEQVDRADFAAYDVVILVDVPTITERSALALRKYLERGGHVLVFLGPRIRPEDYNSALYPDILSFRLEPKSRLSSEALRIVRRVPDHPLFAVFDEENIDLSEPGFSAHWDLVAGEDPAGRPLAWYSNGSIAIVESPIEAGNTIAFTSSPGPPWSDLPSHIVFVPFIGEVLKHLLAHDRAQNQAHVGDTVPIRLLGGEDVWENTASIQVSHPGGESDTVPVALTHGSGEIYFDNLKEPGVYRFAWTGSGGEMKVSPEAIAVNPDVRESDLTVFETSAALEYLSAFRTEAIQSSNVEAAIGRLRRGRPVWDYLLLVVLALLAGETIYGNRVRRKDRKKQAGHDEKREPSMA